MEFVRVMMSYPKVKKIQRESVNTNATITIIKIYTSSIEYFTEISIYYNSYFYLYVNKAINSVFKMLIESFNIDIV